MSETKKKAASKKAASKKKTKNPIKVALDENQRTSESAEPPKPVEKAAEAPVISEPEVVEPEVTFDGLSKAEQDALRKKAKEIATKETKQKIEDEFLKAEIEKAKKDEAKRLQLEDSKEKKLYPHTVRLSSASDHIRVGGQVYKHGQTYMLTQGQKSAFLDIESRGFEQERIRKGQGRNEYGLRERDGVRSGSGVVKA